MHVACVSTACWFCEEVFSAPHACAGGLGGRPERCLATFPHRGVVRAHPALVLAFFACGLTHLSTPPTATADAPLCTVWDYLPAYSPAPCVGVC